MSAPTTVHNLEQSGIMHLALCQTKPDRGIDFLCHDTLIPTPRPGATRSLRARLHVSAHTVGPLGSQLTG